MYALTCMDHAGRTVSRNVKRGTECILYNFNFYSPPKYAPRTTHKIDYDIRLLGDTRRVGA